MSTPSTRASAWVVDASVAAKWFRPTEQEPEGLLARQAIDGLVMQITTLTVYEVGNLLVRRAGRDADRVRASLELLQEICGEPLALLPQDHGMVAELGLTHGLTFYDASYVAIAHRVGRGVLSADEDLVGPGLASTLADALGSG
jgi:predicted nucleic acid-binding protein